MSDALPEIFFNSRLVAGVPAPFKEAVERAARAHNAPVADFIREALNVALRNEPTSGQDRVFFLLPPVTGKSVAKRSKVL
ncbi:MAG: hypothetical protein JWO28_2638 [Hyphomicrobiales bacterium]|nr:hypothetical protein [Hyphomicrobiales bacterium]